MKLKMLLLAAAASCATPALAVQITLTLSGNFTGTSALGAFQSSGTFTGVGDTDNAYLINSSLVILPMSSLTATGFGTTVTFEPTSFFIDRSTNFAGVVNPAVTRRFLGFLSPALGTYDGMSNLAPTSVSFVDSSSFGPFQSNIGPITITSGSNLTFSATVAQVTGPVPEPATWGLMLVGFGGVGYAMRRSRRVSVRFA